jgi:hypothetical protein
VASPAAVPAATAGIVGVFASASVELAHLSSASVVVSAPKSTFVTSQLKKFVKIIFIYTR